MNAAETRKMKSEIEAALGLIAAKYGLSLADVDLRRFRGDLGVRLMKLDMIKSASGPSATFKSNSALEYGMNLYGITRSTNSKGEKLVEYKASRPKYPFVMEGPRGGRWKLEADVAKAKFG